MTREEYNTLTWFANMSISYDMWNEESWTFYPKVPGYRMISINEIPPPGSFCVYIMDLRVVSMDEYDSVADAIYGTRNRSSACRRAYELGMSIKAFYDMSDAQASQYALYAIADGDVVTTGVVPVVSKRGEFACKKSFKAPAVSF